MIAGAEVVTIMPRARFNPFTAFSWWLAFLIAAGMTCTQGASPGTWPNGPQVTCRLTLRGAQFSTADLTCNGNVTLDVAPELKQVLKASPGITLTANNGSADIRFAFVINVFQQNIVFEDSVLDGLVPPAGHGIISMVNSTVSFVRLMVKSCTVSGSTGVVLSLGTFNNTKPESLTIQDSHFMHNSCVGDGVLWNGCIVWQSSGKLLISNSQFISNMASNAGQVLSEWSGFPHPANGVTLHACTFRNNSAGTNGCMYVYGSTLVEMSGCTFEDNRVHDGRLAGALQVSSVAAMRMQRCRFINNHVGGTGAAASFLYSAVSISNTVLIGNTAMDGGAFYVGWSILELSSCIFAVNRAEHSGGAVYSINSTVTATNTTFSGNSASTGGAWYSDSYDILTLAQCEFTANVALAGSGGALCMLSYSSVGATSTRFFNNSALISGGAVLSKDSSNTTLVDCAFTGNTVDTAGGSGGALQLGAGNRVAANGTQFEGNNATFGGAVASTCQNSVDLVDCQLVLNAANDLGGALYIADGTLDVCRDNGWSLLTVRMCSFQNNTAGAGGGAAYIANGAGLNSSSCEFLFNRVGAGGGGGVLLEAKSSWGCSNTSFWGNQALPGGAVAATQSAKASFSGACVFSGNAAVEGGAVLVDGAGVVLEDCTLRGNTAQQGGGLLTRNVADLTTGRSVQLVGNTAHLFGGGMLVDFECTQQAQATCNTTRLDISGSTVFAGNTAGRAGPNIYAAAPPSLSTRVPSSRLPGPQWLAGPVAEVVVQGEGLGAYVSSDDVYLDLKVLVLDAWRQPVAVDPMQTTMQPVQVTLALNQSGAAGALLLGQTQAAATGGVALLQKATLRARPGQYQLIVTALDAPLAKPAVVQVTVRPCQVGELNQTDRSVCLRCPAGQFSLDPYQPACLNCPAHATCPGGAALLPDKGYWQSSPRSLEVHKCLQPGACRGIAVEALQCSAGASKACDPPLNATRYQALQCGEGYSGNLCGKCRVDAEVQYSRVLRFKCSRCRGKGAAGITAVVLVVVVCAALLLLVVINMVRDSEAPVHVGDYLRVLIRHFQHLLLLSYLDVQWHAVFSWLHTVSRWLFDATGSGSISVDCLLPAGGLPLPRAFASKLIAVLLPLGTLLPVIGAAMYLRHSVWNKVRMREHFTAGSWWQTQQSVTPFNTFMVAVVTGLSFFYSSLANQILGVFYCLRLDTIAGSPVGWRHGYWAGDLDVKCYQGWHLTLVLALGVPGVLLVCIGVPATLVLLLLRSRLKQNQQAPVYKFGFLLACYRPELWFWEAVRQLQLLAAVALVVFTPLLPLSAQAAVLLLLFCVITFCHVALAPFKDARINTLEFSALMTTLVNICGVLLISGGATDGDGSLKSILLGLAVLTMNIMLFALIIYTMFATQLAHAQHLRSKRWTTMVFFVKRLLHRCWSGCSCWSRSSPSA